MIDIQTKLLSKIVKEKGPLETECWLWTGMIGSNGYGRVAHYGWKIAHRTSYEVFVGPIPEGMQINHHCDVRHCIRPEHLYAGTVQDNIDDMWERGRAVSSPGTRNGSAKLNEEDVKEVLEMLAEGYSQNFVADYFGVEQTNISAIACRKSWAWVPGPRPQRRPKSSQFIGVYKYRDGWRAHLALPGKSTSHHLGKWGSERDAAIAYNWHVGWYGLNRPLNIIPEE